MSAEVIGRGCGVRDLTGSDDDRVGRYRARPMLAATLLALGAAVMHAGWNLAVKTSGDRFGALWGQFFIAGILCAVAFPFFGMPAEGWIWAGLSGLIHVPYSVYLARAYDSGEFSVVYPIARGGGAALAAVGGIAFLGDELSVLALLAIATITVGLAALAGSGAVRPSRASIGHALIVAATIGGYSLSDAHGIRTTGTGAYALATFVTGATWITAYGVVSGRGPRMRLAMRDNGRRYALTAVAVVVTYSMVQFAFERAPVGYVTALRESSVVIAALVGSRYLGEQGGRRRAGCALTVLAGLVLLVAAR